MTDKFKPDAKEIKKNMNRMLNNAEVKVVADLLKMLDVRGVPIDDIPEELINLKAVKELEHRLCQLGKDHNLNRLEMVLAVRCALFDVIWDYTLVTSEVDKQRFQHENK